MYTYMYKYTHTTAKSASVPAGGQECPLLSVDRQKDR